MSSGSHSTSTGSPHDGNQPVVYVVDDDESMRFAVGNLLRSVGLRVETFETSGDFLAFAKYDAPSCLILDIRLRGENGLALQEHVRKRGVRMPIVFMTGHGDIPMTVQAMKAGQSIFFRSRFATRRCWMPSRMRWRATVSVSPLNKGWRRSVVRTTRSQRANEKSWGSS